MKNSVCFSVLGAFLLLAPTRPVHGAEPTAAENAATLDSARDELSKWVEARKLISHEREEWELGREILQRRVELLESEIATLQAKIEETQGNIVSADEKRQELVAENRSLEEALAALVGAIDTLEDKTRRLVGVLPEPVRGRIEPLSARLSQGPPAPEASLSTRFQNVIGILNEVNKFNREVTLVSELRTLAGGESAEVQALYLGLGQAYYVTAKGDAAGIGRPTPDGWKWTPRNDLAGDVRRAIAILQNEEVPAYVPLPVEIR